MSLTVKAFLMKEGGEHEIRRFSVDQEVSTNYSYLTNKILTIFPGLTNQAYRTLWKDPENDYIAFSSDDELTEALGFVNDGVFRVYIKKYDPSTKENADQGGVPHPGVVCDGCEGPVRGIRYKCVVCPDYDLCSTCEATGLHKDHEMMRICTPRAGMGGWMGFGFFPPPPYGAPHHGPPHHGPPHHGPPPPPFMGMDGVPPPPPPPHGPCHDGPPGPHGPEGFGPGREPQWRRWMRRNLRRWVNQNGEECGEDKKKEKSDESKTEDGGSSDEGEASPTGDYLKDVGARVAAMLDPLGIDVEVDVEHGGKRNRCPGGRGQGHGHPGAAHGCPWGNNPWAWGNGYCPQQADGGPTTSAPNKQSETGETEAPEQSKDTEMEVASSNAETGEEAAAPSAPGAAAATEADKPASTSTSDRPADVPMTDAPKPRDSSPSPDTEWTIIQDNATPADRTSGARLYPEVSPPAPEPPVTQGNLRVQQALEHMAAMGFGDEGGWLTRLLEVHGGDINKALDAIRAIKPQQK